MHQVTERAILDAIESVTHLAVLEFLCARTNSSHTTHGLASRLGRDEAEVEQALTAFRRAGFVRVEIAEGGARLHSLSADASVWQFAQSFSARYGQDSRFSQHIVGALVRNTGLRTARLAAAA